MGRERVMTMTTNEEVRGAFRELKERLEAVAHWTNEHELELRDCLRHEYPGLEVELDGLLRSWDTASEGALRALGEAEPERPACDTPSEPGQPRTVDDQDEADPLAGCVRRPGRSDDAWVSDADAMDALHGRTL
jgi:hypothetical protein